jgi:hypothetical protein
VQDHRDPELKRVWEQGKIPVVFRGGKSKPLLVRLPYANTNREWLRGEHRNKPKWLAKFTCWETPKAWFESLIKSALWKYNRVYVIQPFNVHEKCAPACWNAVGAECECSCMGEHHGSGNPGGKWHVVSETLAVRWGPRQYSCRLLTRPEREPA